MNVLFLCSRNQWRSPTAEAVYRQDPRVRVQSAGVSSSARRCVSEALLRWADLVLVMEHTHKQRLRSDYPGLYPDLTIGVLDVPDDYLFMDPDLIELLKERVEPWISSACVLDE